jgi:PIN domain nuclease of toxin-antitoxin system
VNRVPLLDTHVWIWWVEGDPRLHPQIAQELDALPEKHRPIISGISLWEVAMLTGLGRLNLNRPLDAWFRLAANARTVQTWPITVTIAAEVAALPDTFHRDPADRIIVATSRTRNWPLLTMDRRIVDSGLAEIWSPSRVGARKK